MKKKIIHIIILLLMIMMTFSGCLNGKYDPSLSIGEQIKTRHYDHSAMVFGKNELLDEILESSEAKDTIRIKELFSDYAVETNKDINKEIDEYINNFPDVKELSNRGCSEFGSHNQGSTEYDYLYEPVVHITDNNDNKYRLIIMWIEGNSEHPDRQGIHSIQLISEDVYNKKNYTIHSRDDRPGVYVYK